MSTDHAPNVAGSWAVSITGWAMSGWAYLTEGMAPLTAMATALTVVLTLIKLAQEVSAWRRRDHDRQMLRKVYERMQRLTRPGDMS